MSDEVKNNELNAEQEKKSNPVSGFFKRFTGAKHPTISIIIFNAAAMLLMLLTLFIDGGIVVPILYAACLLIPLTYVRPLGVITVAKAVVCAVVAGVIIAAADSGTLAMYSANIPVLSIITVIIIWAAAHVIYFAAGAFAYKVSFSRLSLPAVILFSGSILTEIIYEIGLTLILGGQPVPDSGMMTVSGGRAFSIVFVAIRLLLVSLSVCAAAKYSCKLREKE